MQEKYEKKRNSCFISTITWYDEGPSWALPPTVQQSGGTSFAVEMERQPLQPSPIWTGDGELEVFVQTVERVGGVMNLPLVEIRGKRCAAVEGFNLHADVDVDADDRDRLEKLCRYMARPAIARERLSWRSDGRLSYHLKRPWSDGTTHVVFEPSELLEKLCALVPAPNKNLVRYSGVFAPNAKWRSMIVPSETTNGNSLSEANTTIDSSDLVNIPASDDPGRETTSERRRSRRRPWAELMARVLQIDSLACGQCGGRMKQISTITDPNVIMPFLDCLGITSTPPSLHPARPPPDPEEIFDW